MKKNELLYIIPGLAALLALKLYFDGLAVDEIRWVLNPVVWLVGPMTGLDFVWVEGKGYFNEHKLIMINKSCAGLSYLLIVLGLSLYMSIKLFSSNKPRLLAILVLLPVAYCLTIFANASRIATATFLLPFGEIISFFRTDLFHYTLGMAIYLVLLAMYYKIIFFSIKKQ